MTLNPENDEMTESTEELETPELDREVSEDEPISEMSETTVSETPDSDSDEDENLPDPSGQSVENDNSDVTDQVDAAESSPDEATADVTYEGDRPLVQELQYQESRAKNAGEDDESHEVARFGSVAEARAVVEGFLFSSNEPLSVKRLSKLMNNLHPKTVRGLLLELQWEYENRAGALQVVEIAGGYQLSTRPFVAPWMFRLHKLKRRSPLSPATLETLAIVAYRQPITKGEIEGIRGVESGAPLRTLQELGLLEASGRKEVIGRPQLYITTEQFLKVFGLKSLADLPSIAELKSRFADEQKLKPKVSRDTPAEEPEEQPVPSENEQVEEAVTDVSEEGAEENASEVSDESSEEPSEEPSDDITAINEETEDADDSANDENEN